MKHNITFSEITIDKKRGVYSNFEENLDSIEQYINEVMWWNKKVNVVSRDVSRETLLNHVLHSLIISQSNLLKSAHFVIDTGTGGGLPGIPLALTHPEKSFILNDIVNKKMMVCKQILTTFGLKNTRCEAGSIEDLQWEDEAVLITKHAFKLNGLYKMIRTKSWSGLVMLKGSAEVEQELDGIDEPLDIKIYNLYPAFKDPFFEGKAMVEITG